MVKRRETGKFLKKKEMSRQTKLFLYFLIGFSIYPFLLSLIRALFCFYDAFEGDTILNIPSNSFLLLVSTVISLSVFAFVHMRVVPFYIVMHEMTHAIFGFLSGAKVSDFRVKDTHGSVKVSKQNVFNILSPYFVSLLVCFVLVIYGIGCIAVPHAGVGFHYFFDILIGLALGFHIYFTLNGLLQRQSDVEEYGYFFSYMFIIFMNVVGLLIIISSIEKISFISIFSNWMRLFASQFVFLWDYLWGLSI